MRSITGLVMALCGVASSAVMAQQKALVDVVLRIEGDGAAHEQLLALGVLPQAPRSPNRSRSPRRAMGGNGPAGGPSPFDSRTGVGSTTGGALRPADGRLTVRFLAGAFGVRAIRIIVQMRW